MADVPLVQNDLTPSIQQTLLDVDGKTPQVLTGTTVAFFFRRSDGTGTLKGGACTIVNAANGVVRYDLQAGDLADPGQYLAEWVVTFAGGKPGTWPPRHPLTIEIRARLA